MPTTPTKLSPKEKMDIYKHLESNLAMGITVALDIFNEKLGDIIEKKTDELKDAMGGVNVQLAEGKPGEPGYTPKRGVDYYTDDEIEELAGEVLSRAKPVKGKDYMTPAEVKEMAAAVRAQIRKPEDGKTPKEGVDYPTVAQVKAYIDACVAELPPAEDGETPSKELLIKLINRVMPKPLKKITPENPISVDCVRGLKEELRLIKKLLAERNRGGGDRGQRVGGGGDIMYAADLSSQCDGATKSFTVPKFRKAIAVYGTEFPIVYRPLVDWTASGTTLTLGAGVSAPASGQTLTFQYIV